MSIQKEEDIIKIINLTPHAITIYDKSLPLLSIPSSGQIARCSEEKEFIDNIKAHEYISLPVFKVIYGPVEGLPEPTHNTIYIVSKMVADAKPDRDDLYFPGDLKRNSEGAVIGCYGLSKI